jgi:tetratricopeptide (TPR) repeat protein
MYQLAIKSIGQTAEATEKRACYSECLGLAHLKNKQFDAAIVALNKSLHTDPSSLHTWFNLALVSEDYAVSLLRKQQRTVKDIHDAIKELNTSSALFLRLTSGYNIDGTCTHSAHKYARAKAAQHHAFCLVYNPN